MKIILVFYAALLAELTAASPAGKGTFCDTDARDTEDITTKIYTLITEKMAWSDARDHCHSLCQTLATVLTDEEQNNLQNIIQGADTESKIWIGGYCESDNDCRWKNNGNQIDYPAYWKKHEPITYNARTNIYFNCVSFDADGSDKNLKTANCEDSKPFACQYYK